MIDYNDGEWHGWNGGECPVHPESLVVVKFDDGDECGGNKADEWTWGNGAGIIAFRVVKEYKEPLEFWIDLNGHAHDNPHDAAPLSPYQRSIHVREVRE